MKYFLVLCFLIQMAFSGLAQENRWMVPPVKHGVGLAGTFGELRKNHFHTGVDIKSSNGQIGDPIFAVADGFVSRVKVSASGYGNTLYIDHPNGMTTVYAHLSSFKSEIGAYVDSLQYDNNTFEIDTTVVSSRFPVAQGEQIGVMGTTGRSYGPHLHFEVRHTSSEKAVNPLAQGIEITDQLSPKVNYMVLQHLDNELKEYRTQKIELTKRDNIYTPSTSEISIPAWRVGLAVYVQDLMTGVSNKNGIYEAALEVDGVQEFLFRMDTIGFDEFRKLDGHIDFHQYVDNKVYMHQLYKKPGMNMGIYKQAEDAVISLYAAKPRDVKISLRDYHGNSSVVQFKILRDTLMEEYSTGAHNYLLPYGKPHIISRNDIKIKFSEDNFYEDTYLNLERTDEKEANYVSPVFHIGDKKQATFDYYDLYIRHELQDSTLLSKAFIAACDGTTYTSFGGKSVDEMVGAKVRDFGTYVVMIDTIPPSVEVVSAPYELKNGSSIILKIDDNIEVRGYAQDLKYEATVDGKWLLFEYDLKTKRIIHKVSNERWENGKHNLSVRVSDDRGNSTVWTKEVQFRK